MRILAIEDNVEKANGIRSLVSEVSPDSVFVVCEDLHSAWKELFNTVYDLIVLDLMMPLTKNGQPQDVGGEVINVIGESQLNRAARIVALTGYEDLFEQQATRFAELGVLLVYFDEFSGKWKKTIRSMIRRASVLPRCDFVIICALDGERDAFERTDALVGPRRVEHGFDLRRIEIGRYVGNAILQPRAGLVDSSVTTAAVVERFRPRLIAMSGICAGMRGRVKKGQVLVCGTCWEYQVGKYGVKGFEIEPYQSGLREPVRQILSRLCKSNELVKSIYADCGSSDVVECPPKMANIVSGSAVIADEDIREGIRLQHRKIDGIEMEMAGVFRAVQLVNDSVVVIGAKAVADFADSKKDDKLHAYACTLSARFIKAAIDALMTEHVDVGIGRQAK